ncbi:molecular chaperone DnaJ [Candidatus Kuenenbacteria bacterium]|nr:molecular chaperone DnaJ [Candidatus Kuenenbacteria bacterium]
MSKDYYKILNVEKGADQDEIKRAFRKLAHKYHPDKETGDEAKFKEINEAYQVLGKPEKRKQYDQFGSSFDQMGGFGGGMNWSDFMSQARGGGGGANGAKFDFGGLDLGDIFGDMFGFGGGRNGRSRGGGEDIQVDFEIGLKDVINGIKKEVELYKTVKCEHCHGNMAEPGTPINACSTCNGQGRVTRVQQTMLGAFQSSSTCTDCHGSGKKAETPCSKCSGQGVTKKKEKINIEIPAGIEDGSTLRLTGKGNAAPFGGEAGDLYVRVRIRSDKVFQRHGKDIYMQNNISFVEAALGGEIDVGTLESEVSLKIPAGTQPGTKFRLKGKGMPQLHGSTRGDMYVVIEVAVPKKLSRKQRKLLEDFE